GVIRVLGQRFDTLHAPAAESICYATTNRQEAVKEAASGVDFFLIVGAPNSSNSRRLVEVAERGGAKNAALVQCAEELDWNLLQDAASIGHSAGASEPEILVDGIIDAFSDRFDVTVELAATAQEPEQFPVMRALRNVGLEPDDMAFLNGNA